MRTADEQQPEPIGEKKGITTVLTNVKNLTESNARLHSENKRLQSELDKAKGLLKRVMVDDTSGDVSQETIQEIESFLKEVK